MADVQRGKLRLAVLISGRGSNLKALIEACKEPDFPAQIDVVISNVEGALGLQVAANAGIATHIVDHKRFIDRKSFETALTLVLEAYPIDYVCLSGFMRVLSEDFVTRWRGRIINIHPSLLPAYKGLHTHQRAIDDGVNEAGCTVHIVTEDLDDGPILVQRKVPVLPDDTAQILADRVLVEEHKAYREAIIMIADSLFKAK
jgi:phosphoribosylglycinamide formyltransferase-1